METIYQRTYETVRQNSWYDINKNNKQNRRDYNSIIRLKIGHGKYTVHLYKINLFKNPICLCEKKLGALDPIIFEKALTEFSKKKTRIM